MIERYCRPEMSKVWSDKNKLTIWLKIELAVCEELASRKVISKSDWLVLKKQGERLLRAGGVDLTRVAEIEQTVRHDVIAFTAAVAEQVGSQSRYIHFGLTSSDVLDTGLALQVQHAGEILLQGVDELLKLLKKLANQYRSLPTIGRSHGVYAEPTSFGLKFLGWYSEWLRNRRRLVESLEQMRFGKLSGAVGVSPHWGVDFEEKVLKKFNLNREPVSTQVIPRDRHAHWVYTLSLLGTSLERLAVELRHLQRSEVAEVIEGFQKGQKGSSAMPHKRNPISSENITGCARLLRSYAQAAQENIVLWHERDMSHSSVERMIFPDSALLLDYALNRVCRILSTLGVREDQVKHNLEKAGALVYSGHYLLELLKTGVSREQAYAWVQECALQALESPQGDFVQELLGHSEISKRLTQKKIQELASIQYQMRHVDQIFREVGTDALPNQNHERNKKKRKQVFK